MIQGHSTYHHQKTLGANVKAFLAIFSAITKLRLSLLVVFSALMSYWFAGVDLSLNGFIYLGFAGFFITASSIMMNQIIERDTDKLMERTKNRPLPSNQISVVTASVIAGIMAVAGIVILGFCFNPISGLLGALSLISYSFIYTPFKKISPIAVFIGAVPGSLPLLIGWTASTGSIGLGGVILFFIQFFWQIPHFWAIAWIANDDYRKAGFHLMPYNEKSRKTALANLPFLILLILVAATPYFIGMCGIISLIVVTLSGIYYMITAIQLSTDLSEKSAFRFMFASFYYLPIVLIALNLDKI